MLIPADLHNEEHLRFLYRMLEYRNDLGFVNIPALTGRSDAAAETPSYEQHKKYLQTTSRYKVHYIWVEDGAMIASVYLTQENELGLFIVRERCNAGLSVVIVDAIRDRHPTEWITCHVHADNIGCNKAAAKCGFKHVANFWVCEPKQKEGPPRPRP